MEERVQKIMARAGLGSRRKNEQLIRAGRVRVNGRVISLGAKADPTHDRIEVDGKPITFDDLVYVMLNKPKGVLSSTTDELEEGRPTLLDLVDLPGHLYPVGRLDKQSEGLILLTNDGHLAHRLTHPRYEHKKVYRVVVEGHPMADTLRKWSSGILLDGKRTAPAGIVVKQKQAETTTLEITMREGRKRQIRRVAAQLGHPVQSLVRIRIGPLFLGDLPIGQWRHLTREEVRRLKQSVQQAEQKNRP